MVDTSTKSCWDQSDSGPIIYFPLLLRSHSCMYIVRSCYWHDWYEFLPFFLFLVEMEQRGQQAFLLDTSEWSREQTDVIISLVQLGAFTYLPVSSSILAPRGVINRFACRMCRHAGSPLVGHVKSFRVIPIGSSFRPLVSE